MFELLSVQVMVDGSQLLQASEVRALLGNRAPLLKQRGARTAAAPSQQQLGEQEEASMMATAGAPQWLVACVSCPNAELFNCLIFIAYACARSRAQQHVTMRLTPSTQCGGDIQHGCINSTND